MASVIPQGASEASLTSDQQPSPSDGVMNQKLDPEGSQPLPETGPHVPPQKKSCSSCCSKTECNVLMKASIIGLVVHLIALVTGVVQITLRSAEKFVYSSLVYTVIGAIGILSDIILMVGAAKASATAREILLRVGRSGHIFILIWASGLLDYWGVIAAFTDENKQYPNDSTKKNETAFKSEFKSEFGDTTKVDYLTAFIPLTLLFVGFSLGVIDVITGYAREFLPGGPRWRGGGGGVAPVYPAPVVYSTPAPGGGRPNVEP